LGRIEVQGCSTLFAFYHSIIRFRNFSSEF
jgi:hypothetical protein